MNVNRMHEHNYTNIYDASRKWVVLEAYLKISCVRGRSLQCWQNQCKWADLATSKIFTNSLIHHWYINRTLQAMGERIYDMRDKVDINSIKYCFMSALRYLSAMLSNHFSIPVSMDVCIWFDPVFRSKLLIGLLLSKPIIRFITKIVNLHHWSYTL